MVDFTVPLNKMRAKWLASMILESQKIREDSYDIAASDAAGVKAEQERLEQPDNLYAGLVDYEQFYRLSMEEAADKACEEIGYILYLLNRYVWNDAQLWAQNILIKDEHEQQSKPS